MKILHFIPSLIRGGAERVAIDLANETAHRGHQVVVLSATRHPPELMPAPLREDVEVRYVHRGENVRAAQLRLLPWAIANRRWLLDHDIIHCHLWLATEFGAFLQMIRGRDERPAIVETYHAVGMPIPKHHRALHALLLSGRDAVAFMAEDPYWQRYRALRRKRLFRTIPNGVAEPVLRDGDCRARERELTSIPANALVVGSVSRLAGERRPDLLVEVFSGISRAIPNAHLLIGGEGPERASLEMAARDAGLAGHVHMPGLILDVAVPLANIDLYLTVAVGPTVGVAALEAALFGKPVIAIQLLPDYRPGDDDWFWSSGNPADVSARAVELLNDEPSRKTLAERQKQHVAARYSAQAMGEAYEQFYRDALKRRRDTSSNRAASSEIH